MSELESRAHEAAHAVFGALTGRHVDMVYPASTAPGRVRAASHAEHVGEVAVAVAGSVMDDFVAASLHSDQVRTSTPWPKGHLSRFDGYKSTDAFESDQQWASFHAERVVGADPDLVKALVDDVRSCVATVIRLPECQAAIEAVASSLAPAAFPPRSPRQRTGAEVAARVAHINLSIARSGLLGCLTAALQRAMGRSK